MRRARRCRSPRGERGLKYLVKVVTLVDRQSLPSRGAWIEIGGLHNMLCVIRSLPSRGAWIEIKTNPGTGGMPYSRSPHGECGLKYFFPHPGHRPHRRSPHGERGLKSRGRRHPRSCQWRRSPRGECGLKFHGGRDGDSRTIAIPHMGCADCTSTNGLEGVGYLRRPRRRGHGLSSAAACHDNSLRSGRNMMCPFSKRHRKM